MSASYTVELSLTLPDEETVVVLDTLFREGGRSDEPLEYPRDFLNVRNVDIIFALKKKLHDMLDHSDGGVRDFLSQRAAEVFDTPVQFLFLQNNNRKSTFFGRAVAPGVLWGHDSDASFCRGLVDEQELSTDESEPGLVHFRLAVVVTRLRPRDESADEYIDYVVHNRAAIFVDISDLVREIGGAEMLSTAVSDDTNANNANDDITKTYVPGPGLYVEEQMYYLDLENEREDLRTSLGQVARSSVPGFETTATLPTALIDVGSEFSVTDKLHEKVLEFANLIARRAALRSKSKEADHADLLVKANLTRCLTKELADAAQGEAATEDLSWRIAAKLHAASFVLSNFEKTELCELFNVQNEDSQHTAMGDSWQVNLFQAFREEEPLLVSLLEMPPEDLKTPDGIDPLRELLCGLDKHVVWARGTRLGGCLGRGRGCELCQDEWGGREGGNAIVQSISQSGRAIAAQLLSCSLREALRRVRCLVEEGASVGSMTRLLRFGWSPPFKWLHSKRGGNEFRCPGQVLLHLSGPRNCIRSTIVAFCMRRSCEIFISLSHVCVPSTLINI